MARIEQICVFFRDVATLSKDSNRNKAAAASTAAVT